MCKRTMWSGLSLLVGLALALAWLPAARGYAAAPAAGLLLYNTLDSPTAVENSEVGPAGRFAGGGRFVPGRVGAAYVAGPGDAAQITFPSEVLNYRAGTIELWAKISTIAGREIPWGPQPGLVRLADPAIDVVYDMGFTSNDGAGNGGLAGKAGYGQDSGSHEYWATPIYDAILGADAEGWHHYALVWDAAGLPGVDNGRAKVAVYLDNRLVTRRWEDYYPGEPDFVPLTGGRLALRHDSAYHGVFWGDITYDELKIWDHARIPEPRPLLIVGSHFEHRFLLFDGYTGQYIREFIAPGRGGLAYPQYIVQGPDGRLYVSASGDSSVKRYDAQTGAYLGDFVAPGSGGIGTPDKLIFRDGYLYLSDRFTGRVLRYDATTGALAGTVVEDERLGGFITFAFGPDGHIYAGEFNGLCIRRYDGQTGADRGTLVCANNYGAWGDLLFASDGWLYASRHHLGEIWQIHPVTGRVNTIFTCPGSTFANFLDIGPDGRLYTNNMGAGQLYRFDIPSGVCQGSFLSGGLSDGELAVPFAFITGDVPTAPATPILDSFSRSNGPLRSSWGGNEGRGGYQIIAQQLDVVGGGPIYWSRSFGADQEVYVTLVHPDADGASQSLILKMQGRATRPWQQLMMLAVGHEYAAGANRLVIDRHIPGAGWARLAERGGVILRDGDQLGARATADGMVRVYLNGVEQLRADAGPQFDDNGGRIGLWFIDAAEALLDDVGGGALP